MSAKKTAEQSAEQTASETVVTTTREENHSDNLENLAEVLQKQLSELSRKKKLADTRALFLSNKENLLQYLVDLTEETKENSFESRKAKVMFQSKHAYREESVFAISHPELILSFVRNLISEIDKKVVELEKQLIA